MDISCITSTLIDNKIDSTMQSWSDSIQTWMGEALATGLKALTTSWVGIGTPGLVKGDPAANTVSDTVGFLQSSLAGLAGVVLLCSLMVSMAKMVLQNKAEPGIAAFHGLLRFIFVSGAGVAVVAALVFITDAFSVWIIDRATGADFAAAMGQMVMDTSGLVFVLYVIFGGIGILVTLVQIVLLLARGGALVVLTGSLGFSAAASTTEAGKAMFQKHCAWIVAFVFYKPGAAIIYAMAFKLMSEETYGFDDTKTVEHLAGLALLFLAIIALPAMIRLASPLSESLASGRGMGGVLAGAAAIAIPTGAMMAKGASGGGSGGSSGGGGTASGGESAGSAIGSPSPDSGGGGSAPAPSGDASGGSSSGGSPFGPPSSSPPASPAHGPFAPASSGGGNGQASPPGQPTSLRWGGTSSSPAT